MREPLCRLTCKNVQWIWTLEQKDAFEKIKDAFFQSTSTQVL